MTTGGKSYYYLTDAIGSVIGLVDADGNEVDPVQRTSGSGLGCSGWLGVVGQFSGLPAQATPAK
ncbi:hypothetical protein ACWEVY_20810 [Streptomyces longwoodensis]